jgi:hypothetical protein
MMVLWTLVVAVAAAQSETTLTYQGRLLSGGQPLNGTADVQFRLINAAVGGSQVGQTQVATNVSVSDGLFVAELDFGATAFNGDPRWLEILVRSPAGSGQYEVLSPRQPITRAPYAMQTRGIYADPSHNIGLGTKFPEAPLHVQENSAGAVTAQSSSTAVFERNGQNFVSILSPESSERGILFGDPGHIANGAIVFNNASTPDGMEFRTGGNINRMYLKSNGRLGLGTSNTFGQLSVGDGGAQFGIDAASSDPTFPTLFANNTGGGPALWALGTSDIEPTGGGLIVAGDESGRNVAIDRNQIMARDNGQTSTLYLNADGGDVRMGAQRTMPAFAYGFVESNGTIVSASPNVISVRHPGPGLYYITVDGGFSSSDICIATPEFGYMSAGANLTYSTTGELFVMTYYIPDLRAGDGRFNFVVYRP